MAQKRIAVQLFGHLRTFKKTFASFNKHIVEPNKKNGYKVDIFIHTWDEYESRKSTWHDDNKDLKNKKINQEDIQKIKQVYLPKKIIIDKSINKHGAKISMTAVKVLREEYERDNSIEYDWIIETRPDIEFTSNLIIDDYINTFSQPELKNNGFTYANSVFCGNNIFNRLNIAVPGLIAEGDIIYFFKPDVNRENCNYIPIKYFLFQDFHLERSIKKIKKDKKIFKKIRKSLIQIKLKKDIKVIKLFGFYIINNKGIK